MLVTLKGQKVNEEDFFSSTVRIRCDSETSSQLLLLLFFLYKKNYLTVSTLSCYQ